MDCCIERGILKPVKRWLSTIIGICLLVICAFKNKIFHTQRLKSLERKITQCESSHCLSGEEGRLGLRFDE